MSQLIFLELSLTFCMVVEMGCHVSNAAKKLGLTQPAVTMQLRRLEKLYRKRLFLRQGSRLTLTRDGHQFYVMVSGYGKSFSEFEQLLQQNFGMKKDGDSLSLLGNQSSYHYILPGLTKQFLDRFPEANLHISLAETEEAISLISSGEVDIAILPRRTGVAFPASLVYYPTFFFEPCLITPIGHPLAGRKNLTLAEISGYDLILPAPDLLVVPNVFDIFPKSKNSKKLRVQMRNVESGRRFVEAGVGITISSNIILEPDDPYLVATPLTHLFPVVDYGLLVSNNRFSSPLWSPFFQICSDWEIQRRSRVGRKSDELGMRATEHV